jgi:cytochrome P450
VPPDAKVRVVFASANRDEALFPDPHAFRIDRPVSELRRHIAFGHGTHACIGSALARAELRTALRTVLTRLPGLALDPDRPPVRTTSWTVNGWASVPCVW